MDAPEPVLFDTSVYVDASREGAQGVAARLVRDRLPRTHLAIVVAAELSAGAVTPAARRAVQRLWEGAKRVRRLAVPTPATWHLAGDVMYKIRRREPAHRSKLPSLWPDLLIALSARQVGARLYTRNRTDFELIRRYVDFKLTVVDGSSDP